MGQVGSYLILVLLVLVGYAFVIRPNQMRKKAAARLQSAISSGDGVLLSSGFVGTIESMDDRFAHVEIAPGVVIRVDRRAVVQRIVDQPTMDDPDDPDDPDDNGPAGPLGRDDDGANDDSDQNRGVS